MEWQAAAVVVLVPAAYFLVARVHRGFRDQYVVVVAGEPGAFATALEKAGGPASVRAGLVIDLGFIAALSIPAGVVVARSEWPWLIVLPVVASGLDLIENALLAKTLRAPEVGRLRLLRRLAPAKNAAYGVALLVAVVVAARG